MRKSVLKAFIFAVAVVFVMSAAGCEEQNQAVAKKHRLMAAENIELKRQLEQYDKEIEEQKKLLEKCLGKKKVLEEKRDEQLEEIVGVLLKDSGENVKLKEENTKLTAQMEELQKENSNLKAEIKRLEEEVKKLKEQTAGAGEPLPL